MATPRIERRIPFGFMGDWGKLFKRYVFDETMVVDESATILHQGERFVDIGEDLQFKRADDAKWEIKQEIKGAISNDKYIIAKTTDAYWDSIKQQYECVIAPLDIVKVFGSEWMVKSIVTRVKHTPNPLKFFYLGLVNLADLKTPEEDKHNG